MCLLHQYNIVISEKLTQRKLHFSDSGLKNENSKSFNYSKAYFHLHVISYERGCLLPVSKIPNGDEQKSLLIL